VTTGRNGWKCGTDVVVEGAAQRVTGRERLLPLAEEWVAKYGDNWAWDADDEGFTAGDGSQAWVYDVTPAKVIAFGKDPHSQTTYRPWVAKPGRTSPRRLGDVTERPRCGRRERA
jgi:hypothetical protein